MALSKDFENRLSVQGCALAEPGGPWHRTFTRGRSENLTFFTQIKSWAALIIQVQAPFNFT